MATTFVETELADGYLRVSWQADTTREWKRVLYAVKTMINKLHRTFVPEHKAWTIAPEGRHIFESIKVAAEQQDSEEISFDIADAIIEEQAILNAAAHNLKALPESMQRRALFAIGALMGLRDTVVQFSYSRGTFGAWSARNGLWYYTDGRYSGHSPLTWDDRSLKHAYKRIEYVSEQLDQLDEIWPDKDKHVLRASLLEKYNYKCPACQQRPANLSNLHMHRILPGREGGQYIESNVIILCPGCHKRLEGQPREAIDREAREVGNGE